MRNNQIAGLSEATLENLSRATVRVQLHDNPLDQASLVRAELLLNDTARARIGISDVRAHAEPSPAVSEMWMAQMTELGHTEKSIATAAMILVRFATLWFAVIVGFVALSLMKKRYPGLLAKSSDPNVKALEKPEIAQ